MSLLMFDVLVLWPSLARLSVSSSQQSLMTVFAPPRLLVANDIRTGNNIWCMAMVTNLMANCPSIPPPVTVGAQERLLFKVPTAITHVHSCCFLP